MRIVPGRLLTFLPFNRSTRERRRKESAGNTQSVASFDVFDTVLTRVYATPQDLHEHLEETLVQLAIIPPNTGFPAERAKAETRAWADRGGRQGASLEEIYAALQRHYGWTPETTARALAQEARLELDACRPVFDQTLRISETRNGGRLVCFTSDMHLSAIQIGSMLKAIGVLSEGDRLFVSSDYRALKTTGGLFETVLKELNVGNADFHHTGDNTQADYHGARRVGINSTLYKRALLNRFEQKMLAASSSRSWRERSVASVSKLARLSLWEGDADSQLWDVLSSTIAPFVTAYALWLLQQAKRLGIKKLFFLARDMQIVHEVASLFAKKSGIDLQCEYIFASRQSWQPCSYTGPGEFELFWLTDREFTNEWLSILKRIFGDHIPEDVRVRALEMQERNGRWTKPLIRELLASPSVESEVLEATKRSRHLLLTYLRDRGYSPSPECALVDAGWRGTLQNSLARAFKLNGTPGLIRTFYIGTRHVSGMEKECELIPFLSDADLDHYGFSLVSLIEGFLTANHGSVLGFESEPDSTVRARLAPDPPAELLKQWSLVRAACMTFAEQMIASPAWDCVSDGMLRVLTEPLLELCGDPSPVEASLLSRWLIDVGRGASDCRYMANPMVPKDLAKLLRARLNRTPLADVYLSGPWLRGTVTASPIVWRALANAILGPDRARPK